MRVLRHKSERNSRLVAASVSGCIALGVAPVHQDSLLGRIAVVFVDPTLNVFAGSKCYRMEPTNKQAGAGRRWVEPLVVIQFIKKICFIRKSKHRAKDPR